ncbi:hypothetical protein [Plasticicumulans acidivorans]|uniref:hypothetical protein n=1 Tax=Plasticicumulans acidivorans TaxID=886464 RepID=UPI0011B587AB|nr:hypothetical protein [Plasticicumulans acidivorans]
MKLYLLLLSFFIFGCAVKTDPVAPVAGFELESVTVPSDVSIPDGDGYFRYKIIRMVRSGYTGPYYDAVGLSQSKPDSIRKIPFVVNIDSINKSTVFGSVDVSGARFTFVAMVPQGGRFDTSVANAVTTALILSRSNSNKQTSHFGMNKLEYVAVVERK